jgi:hypothetical protein
MFYVQPQVCVALAGRASRAASAQCHTLRMIVTTRLCAYLYLVLTHIGVVYLTTPHLKVVAFVLVTMSDESVGSDIGHIVYVMLVMMGQWSSIFP